MNARNTGLAVTILFIGCTLVVGLWGLVRSTAPPEGPVDVLWDRTPCARCLMLVGEPSFAAQLHTTAGDVLDFDDPGCLLLFLDESAPEVSQMYFRHHTEDRWLAGDSVAFVHAEATPMGYQLGASDRLAAGAITLEAARERLRRPGQQPTVSDAPMRQAPGPTGGDDRR